MTSLSDDKQADIIDAFTTTSRYLNILNINTFDNMGSQIYLSEVQFKQEGQVALTRSPEFCLKLSYRYL